MTATSIGFCASCASHIRYFAYEEDQFHELEEWKASPSDLKRFVAEESMPLKLVIANLQRFRKCSECNKHLESTFKSAFHMPRTWFTEWCRMLGCYFGSTDTFNEDDELDGHNIWFRFDVKQTSKKNVAPDPEKNENKDYQWWKTNAFIRWDAHSGQSTILLCDPIQAVRATLIKTMEAVLGEPGQGLRPNSRSSPYHIASLFAEHGIVVHDKAVWGIRDLVRDSERAREKTGSADFTSSSLQAAMRHHVHVSETLDTTISIVKDMVDRHKLWLERHPETDESRSSKIINTQTTDRLLNCATALSSLRNRGGSNSDRFDNEIQLSLHAVSSSIAEANQEDSSVMRSLAYIGTAFLPATFVSTLFSMSFFGTDNNGDWTFHNQFWMFWAAAIPVTLLSVTWMWLTRPANRKAFWDAAETVAHLGHEPPPKPKGTISEGIRRVVTNIAGPATPKRARTFEMRPGRHIRKTMSQV